jgi:hypothetical protein
MNRLCFGSDVLMGLAGIFHDRTTLRNKEKRGMTFNSKRLVLIAAIFTLLSAVAFAQSTSGVLVGTVLDPTGAVVPNATVTATNVGTEVQSTATTTEAGQYRLDNLPVGSYDLRVKASGFTEAVLKGIVVVLNRTATANVTLQVGPTSTTVEVTETAVTIDTTTADIQTSFDSKQLADLPIASTGSGVINLSLLSAGVGSSGAVGVGTGPSVAGQRPRNNNFTIEGIDNNSRSVTGPLVYVPNDAVAEFSSLQNQYSPDFGHSSGGQYNQVVKSGTNQFHGSLYEYLQNKNLDAADNLNAVTGNPLHPRYDQNRFGGTIGGPILKNKLFFFFNYERNPIGTSNSTFYDVPTAAGYSTLAGIAGIDQTNLDIFKKYFGTAPTATPAADLPFGSDVLIGPQAGVYYTGEAPFGTPIEVGQISTSLPSYTNYTTWVGSVDYNISNSDQLRGRLIVNRNGFIDTTGYPPVFWGIIPTNNYLATLSEYHNFTPNLTNEFRIGYNRNSQTYPVFGGQTYPGLDQFPSIYIYELNMALGPDPNAPQYGYQNTYQLTDNVSWVHGNHTFKFGFDGIKWIAPQGFTQRARGDYEYAYLSDFLFDYYPDQIAQRSLGDVVYWGNSVILGLYANDSWKVTPNLTVNLGLRYEFQTVPATEKLQTLNAVSNTPGVITFGEPQPQKTNFMPRIGVAYSPGTSGHTSIRAGFGLNYDVLYDNLGLLTLPPQMNTTVDVTGISNPDFSGIPGFLANGGITQPSGAPTPAQLKAGTGGYIPDVKRPESIQWNIGVQHVFHEDYTVEVRYTGTRGLYLPMQIQLNRQPVVNAQNALPIYLQAPSQAQLDSLTNTLAPLTAAYNSGGNVIPAFYNAGFKGIITSYQPEGASTYHGLATQVTRRFSNGMQFVGSYTWSHSIDNSTADVFSTVTTPRRPQDSQNVQADRANSALDHRQRLTALMIYDLPFFKTGNWVMKNIVGNWEIAPIYTYQTGTLFTVQSAIDSNMNGDSWPDRAYVNSNGTPGVGSSTTNLLNSSGQVVAFLAKNPNAMYIAAPKGSIPNSGRNTLHFNPINNVDFSILKRFNITERYKMEFSGRFSNLFNHPQYVGGYINDVAPIGFTGTLQRNFLVPNATVFDQVDQAYSSNPRTIQVSAKFTF